jgi:hypothetical protein
MENNATHILRPLVQYSLDDELFFYICCPICAISLVLSILSFLTFTDAQFKEKLFIYLQLESLIICMDLALTLVSLVYKCKLCVITSTSFIAKNYRTGYSFLANVLEKSQLFTGILAAYSCFKMINDTNAREPWGNPYALALGTCFGLALTNCHFLFAFQIIPYTDVNANNATYYEAFKTAFGESKLYKFLDITLFLLTNGIFLVVLTLLNAAIVIKIRASLSNKIKMTRNDRKARRSKAKLTKMVFVDCANTAVCHFSILIFYIKLNFFANDNSPLTSLLLVIVDASFGFKFFFFYLFNQRFRAVLILKIKNFKNLILLKRPSVAN